MWRLSHLGFVKHSEETITVQGLTQSADKTATIVVIIMYNTLYDLHHSRSGMIIYFSYVTVTYLAQHVNSSLPSHRINKQNNTKWFQQ